MRPVVRSPQVRSASLGVVPTSALNAVDGTRRGLSANWFGSSDFSHPLFETLDSQVDLHQAPAGLPKVWSVRWTGFLTPPRSGRYRFSLSGGGDAALYLNDREVVRIVKQGFTSVSHGVIDLAAGERVAVRIDYSMAPTISPPGLQWGWQIPDTLLDQAVDAARSADAVIVFVSDRVSEGGDRTTLSLPGDQDQLIERVAAANPHTIVVLHTVGPVLMPWLHRVAAVLAAWYPGEEASAAIAALLFGDRNPSGKLPMTFPANENQGPDSHTAQFPGMEGRVEYAEDLQVGYRYYDSQRLAPLFPFGFGLSYTSFFIGKLKVERTNEGLVVSGVVRNSGARRGSEVVQVYVGYPAMSQEPPWQLKGFERVGLAPGELRHLRFVIKKSDLAIWDTDHSRWIEPAGRFQIGIGNSSRAIVQRAAVEL